MKVVSWFGRLYMELGCDGVKTVPSKPVDNTTTTQNDVSHFSIESETVEKQWPQFNQLNQMNHISGQLNQVSLGSHGIISARVCVVWPERTLHKPVLESFVFWSFSTALKLWKCHQIA